MTALRAAVTGDTGDYRLIELNGIETLTGITGVSANVWNTSVANTVLSASVETEGGSGVTPVIRVELGSWLVSAAVGTYNIEYEVDFGSGVSWTWPQDRPDTLKVRAQGDA